MPRKPKRNVPPPWRGGKERHTVPPPPLKESRCGCDLAWISYYRVPYTEHGGAEHYHIVAVCISCGKNALGGAGKWVPKESIYDPDKLPVLPEGMKAGL
jgi:hypothetical protein